MESSPPEQFSRGVARREFAKQMPKKLKKTSARENHIGAPGSHLIKSESIKGSDDVGNFYSSQTELATLQLKHRTTWYAVNAHYWISGGGGKTDDEVMVGDEGGIQDDADEGLAFLDRLIASSPSLGFCRAVDVGAGVGRVTKNILLKRFAHVHLVEGDAGWSNRSRVYLGKKRAGKCTFGCIRLEDLKPGDIFSRTGSVGADLIWVQWTLQYLTDADVVLALLNLAGGLLRTGVLVVKENRPFGVARTDRFQMDTPAGSGRYDITRTDQHHRFLLQEAGLTVLMTERGDETYTYAVCKRLPA